jgi:hypothetical protein
MVIVRSISSFSNLQKERKDLFYFCCKAWLVLAPC